MQVDTNWYWNIHPQHNVTTVPTHKILHPRLEVNAVTDFHALFKSEAYKLQDNTTIDGHIVCTRTE